MPHESITIDGFMPHESITIDGLTWIFLPYPQGSSRRSSVAGKWVCRVCKHKVTEYNPNTRYNTELVRRYREGGSVMWYRDRDRAIRDAVKRHNAEVTEAQKTVARYGYIGQLEQETK